jgi:hypothetical protein
MEAILQRAIQKQSRAEEGISHDELLAAAEEVGIPREDVEEAVAEVEEETRPKVQSPEEIEAAQQAAQLRQARGYRLFRGVAVWFAVSGIMFTVSMRTGHHGFFVISAIWGLALLMRASRLLYPSPERLRKETKRERRERERRRRAEESLQTFERKLTIGTEAIGHLIDRARAEAPPAQGWRPGQPASAPSTRSPRASEPVKPAPVATAAPVPRPAPAPKSTTDKAETARSRIDAGTFERFIAARARVGSAPAEDLDELEVDAHEETSSRSARR